MYGQGMPRHRHFPHHHVVVILLFLLFLGQARSWDMPLKMLGACLLLGHACSWDSKSKSFAEAAISAHGIVTQDILVFV